MARLQDPRFAPDCTITFDGERIPARAGESVAAALIAAGRTVIARSSKYHRPRGAFCLAGSCHQCLARIDGMPNQRTCEVPCRDGLTIESQNKLGSAAHDLLGVVDLVYPRGLDHHRLMTWNRLANRAAVAFSRRLAGLGTLPSRTVPPLPTAAEERVDALVVGAGPAGLGAAVELAAAGRRVLLADRERRAGGHLRCRLELPGDPGPDWAESVAAAVDAAGGEVALGTAVLGLWTDGGLCAALLQHAPAPRLRLVRPALAILAPGTHAEPPAFEDSDLPGLFAARGLLVALAEYGTVAGERVAVIGRDAEGDAVAARLGAAGMRVERVAGEPKRAHGSHRVSALELAGGARVPCDTVVATARGPAAELPRLLGAALALDAAGAVRLDADERHPIAPGVYVAGEILGRMDAGRAIESGRRAAAAARSEPEARHG